MGRVGRFILKVAAVLILIVSAGTFALSLFTGETRNGDNLQSEFDYLITVGISQSGEESSWKDANTASFMDTFVKSNGYEAVYADAGSDQEKQIEDVKGFIKQGVDYIILNPISEIGWDDVLEDAKKAHIPVILVNNGVDTDDSSRYSCMLGSDYGKQMKKAGKWLDEYLKEEDEKKAEKEKAASEAQREAEQTESEAVEDSAEDSQKVDSKASDSSKATDSKTSVDGSKTTDSSSNISGNTRTESSDSSTSILNKIIKGSSSVKDETDSTEEEQTEEDITIKIAAIQESIGSEEQLTRAQGYQTMLEKYSDWEMVAQQTGDNSREEAEKVMKLFLEQEPDLRVVFAESDEMALGAIDAIEKSGKTCGEDGDIIVISFGGSKAGIEAVKEGKLNVTFECNPGQGPKAAELIQRLELSEQVKKVLPATKIMILSGYNEFDYAKMAIKIGVTDYLLKPISSEKLLDAVNKVAEEIRKEQSEKEQMNQYAREMQENKESEKFQFFNQVFAGSMPFGECLEQGKQLGIEISAEGYCVILFKIIMIDHPMDYSEDIVSATEDIENLSEQTEKLLWFRRGVEGWGFIAQGAVGEELTARAQTFREDLEKVLEKYKNLEYFGGIGSQVGRFSEIKRSYNDANRAFAERFSRSLRQFVSYSEVHQMGVQNDVEMHRLGTMAENRKMLERFLKTGTENEVKSFMDAYFDAIGEQNLQSMMLRQYIVMDTFISVQSLGDSLNIEKEDIERELGDVQEVSQYVQELEATRKYLENIVRRMIRLREQASGRRYSEIIEKARDYIGQNYMSENISLNLVASSVNISPSYFSSLFSQEVGSTFVEYLTGVRMEKAKELLMCSDKRTSDIGYEVGYKDSHYFSYIFKKTQGCSPKEFRSRGRG